MVVLNLAGNMQHFDSIYLSADLELPQEEIECSPGCPLRFLNNGRCDSSFNCLTSECSFDGGGELKLYSDPSKPYL
jgi:hypothetical protein